MQQCAAASAPRERWSLVRLESARCCCAHTQWSCRVPEGTPAANAVQSGAIQVGDAIVAVDGVSVLGLEAADISALVLSAEGASVTLRLLRAPRLMRYGIWGGASKDGYPFGMPPGGRGGTSGGGDDKGECSLPQAYESVVKVGSQGIGLSLGRAKDYGSGAEVTAVREDSAAAKAGCFRVGDLLVAINTDPLVRRPLEEVVSKLRSSATAGQNVTMLMWRPAPVPNVTGTNSPGRQGHQAAHDVVLKRTVGEQLGLGLGLNGDDRVAILNIAVGSLASRVGGITEGDLLLGIGGAPGGEFPVAPIEVVGTDGLAAAMDLIKALPANEAVTLRVQTPVDDRSDAPSHGQTGDVSAPPRSSSVRIVRNHRDGSVTFEVELTFPLDNTQGLGIELGASERTVLSTNSRVYVRSVQANSVAAQTGALAPEDVIIGVDGIQVAGAGLDWVHGRILSAKTRAQAGGSRSIKLMVQRVSRAAVASAKRRQAEEQANRDRARKASRSTVGAAPHANIGGDKPTDPKCRVFAPLSFGLPGGSTGFSTRCTAATFGAPIPISRHLNMTIVEVEPVNGCAELSPSGYQGNRWTRGTRRSLLDDSLPDEQYWVIVRRGECFFHTKALMAQNLGASGLLIINDDDNLEPLGVPHDRYSAYIESLKVTIPALLVPRAVGEMIGAVLQKSDRADPELYLAARGPQLPRSGREPFALETHFRGGFMELSFAKDGIARASRGQVGKVNDDERTITVTVDAIANGTNVSVPYTRTRLCTHCNGRGGHHPHLHTCPMCHAASADYGVEHGITHTRIQDVVGPGSIKWEHFVGDQFVQSRTQTCPVCEGFGEVVDEGFECPVCKGKRVMSEDITLNWTIPVGAVDGLHKVFAGDGSETSFNHAGDVILKVVTEMPANFTRRGADVHTSANITLAQALTGFTINVTSWRGDNVSVTQSGVTEEGEVVRLPGAGLPILVDNTEGSLYMRRVANRTDVMAKAEEKLLRAKELVSQARERYVTAWESVWGLQANESGVHFGGNATSLMASLRAATPTVRGMPTGVRDPNIAAVEVDAEAPLLTSSPVARTEAPVPYEIVAAERALLACEGGVRRARAALDAANLTTAAAFFGDLVVKLNVVFPELVADEDRAAHLRETFLLGDEGEEGFTAGAKARSGDRKRRAPRGDAGRQGGARRSRESHRPG